MAGKQSTRHTPHQAGRSFASFAGGLALSVNLIPAALAQEPGILQPIETVQPAQTKPKQDKCEALVSLSKRYATAAGKSRLNAQAVQGMSDALDSYEVNRAIHNARMELLNAPATPDIPHRVETLAHLSNDLYRGHLILRLMAQDLKQAEDAKREEPTLEECRKNGPGYAYQYVSQSMLYAGQRETALDTYSILKGNFHIACEMNKKTDFVAWFKKWQEETNDVLISANQPPLEKASIGAVMVNDTAITLGNHACDISDILKKQGIPHYLPDWQSVGRFTLSPPHSRYTLVQP